MAKRSERPRDLSAVDYTGMTGYQRAATFKDLEDADQKSLLRYFDLMQELPPGAATREEAEKMTKDELVKAYLKSLGFRPESYGTWRKDFNALKNNEQRQLLE